MKTSPPHNIFLKHLALLLTATMVLFNSCKKTDTISPNESLSTNSIEEKFFNSHRTADPTEKALIAFLKKANTSNSFVEKTVAKIGYPRWDKALTTARQIGGLNTFNLLGDSTQTYYVPFVRDSQHFVNASMIIRTSPTDTSFSYRCDWEYTQMNNNIESANDAAEHFAAFFMTLDKAVFGTKKFNIVDTNLFRTPRGHAEYVQLDSIAFTNVSNLLTVVEFCQDVAIYFNDCTYPDNPACIPNCDRCWECTSRFVYQYCWQEIIDIGGGGGDGTGGGGTGGGGTPPDCGEPEGRGISTEGNLPCEEGPGWVPLPIEDEPIGVDVISSPHDPEYPDISDNEPKVSLQSLFNCFSQIPDAGASYSVKLSVDLPVNGVWNAPFNLTQKSPGHTFLTLTKTNGSQTISQSVGFYPIGSGGNPLNPTATGGFKNNGDPKHEYNAAVNAHTVSASQFSMVMNNLLSHENDTYNIFDNNCTTIALNAFNLLISPKITIEPFVVQLPTSTPQPPYFFRQSPQKLYKTIETFQPGTGLNREFNVNNDSPLSTIICP